MEAFRSGRLPGRQGMRGRLISHVLQRMRSRCRSPGALTGVARQTGRPALLQRYGQTDTLAEEHPISSRLQYKLKYLLGTVFISSIATCEDCASHQNTAQREEWRLAMLRHEKHEPVLDLNSSKHLWTLETQ